MWCMHWFLVLFLLPYPQAPSLFLLSLLVVMFLEHKPCLYCSIVILALLATSGALYQESIQEDTLLWLDSIMSVADHTWRSRYWINFDSESFWSSRLSGMQLRG
ncbi:uncharacterized protein BJ171DRAFT_505978 [Polychytrium aggregatum]|uniref:uncharacterized protein n=1 Tax=Polychytrium aggregatum TaxID=110093 RepID=UPI0022FEBC5E|nr:uncharacterized protein BJ171DRAFT_505978 [Polychytrium aggregatum]KAI9204511.1 hypothetical protein BJ171DRAFT_505978 [Polychytrium aggregatum]